jgi:Mg-chelatase subunit ChlD
VNPAAPRGRTGRLAAGAFLLALGALAQWPRWGADAPTRPALTALVLDASASAHRPRPGWIAFARDELAREAARAQAGGEDVLVVAFGREARVLFGPGSGDELEARLTGRGGGAPLDPRLGSGEDVGSDLARALERVQAPLADVTRPPGRLVLIADGRASGRDPRPLLGALRAAETRWVELPAAERVDVALTSLEIAPVPEGAEQIAALELVVEAPARLAPGRLVLHVELERPSGAEQRRIEVAAPAPGRVLRLGLPLGPAEAGTTGVRVRVAAPDGRPDPFPENDALGARGQVGAARVVGLVAAAREAPLALAFWQAGGAPPGLVAEVIEPAGLAERLADLDALVLFDVPRAALPEAALARWLETGGGLLSFDGAQFADLDLSGPLARWWPLLPAPPERPPRDVVLLVDTSGSMAGAPFDGVRAAVLELIDAVPAGDRLWMRFFTGRLFERIPLHTAGGAAGRARLAEQLLALRTPRGATAILVSLEAFADERAGAEQSALVFLLSDGREEGDPPRPAERAAELVQRFAAQGTELVAVAMGPDRLLDTLEHLAPGRVREWDESTELGAILREEVAREARREGRFPLQRRSGEADSLAAALAGGRAPQAVSRLARTRLAEGAETLLAERGGQGAAVLAVARAGAGRIARAAGGPLPGWAEPGDWRAADLSALLTFLAERPRSGARLRWVGEELQLLGAPDGLPARVSGRLTDPGGSERDSAAFELSVPGSGHARPADVRVGRPPPPGARPGGSLWLEVQDVSGAQTLLEPLPVPSAAEPEFAGRRAGWSVGAGDLPAPALDPSPRGAPHALAPWLLGAGLLLLAAGALSGLSEGRGRTVKPFAGADR